MKIYENVVIWVYPLVNIQKAIENGPVEIVDFPRYKMVDLSIAAWMILGNAPLGVKSWMAF
jgi:hypothetical protein